MTEDNRNSGRNSEGRNPDGTFAPGKPGKPNRSHYKRSFWVMLICLTWCLFLVF